MIVVDHFHCLSLEDSGFLRKGFEDSFLDGGEVSEAVLLDLLRNNNWRHKIVGGVGSYYFGLNNHLEDIWNVVKNPTYVSWRFVAIAHEMDSNFYDVAIPMVNEVVKSYKAGQRPIAPLSDKTSIALPKAALLYFCKEQIDNYDKYVDLFHLNLGPGQYAFRNFNWWTTRLRNLGTYGPN